MGKIASADSDGSRVDLKSLSNCIEQLLDSLDADSAKLAQIAINNSRYKEAVKSIWKDEDASRMILEHTNAFYIRKDELPKKGFSEADDYVVCEVCIDDALIRSEVDAHRELLQFALRSNGLSFEEFRIIASKHGMRKRHPFSQPKDAQA